MFRNTPHVAVQRVDCQPPIRMFFGTSALFGVLLALGSLVALDTAMAPMIAFAAAVMVTSRGVNNSYPHPVLGLCNVVTLFRAALVAFLVGAVLSPPGSAWIVFGVALVAFALDGVDGWLARRAALVSDFGARFDMETDAALGAVISLWLLFTGTTGPEILVLGFMRYAFVAASVVWPALQAPLPDSFRRKVICVVQIGALILLVFPWTPQAFAAPLGGIAALLLGWSFLIDILWLARRAA